MNKLYESTRDKEVSKNASEAILQGLSEEGGLFVLRDLHTLHVDIESLIECDYMGIASKVLGLFLNDFTSEEVEQCVQDAYKNKFSEEEITPLVSLKDAHVLELFHGPTSAFKDVALSILPQFTKASLAKNEMGEDILILTATSGDTGKAALEGYKDVDRIKIIVFYPNGGVSKVQETQMISQEGMNTGVCAIDGNFDDAQNGVKQIFLDEEFREMLLEKNIKLSSDNSINIGRLIPQMDYYFYAYKSLVKKGAIKCGEKINFVVPTGNFGNILAGYYAKQIGLPVNKLVCGANDNNVLFDFLSTGTYNKNREFLKTISPSMDILISSNLERLLYYVSGCDNDYVKDLMKELNTSGKYDVTPEIFEKLKESFATGFATDLETKETIAKIYKEENYLMDPHTAVAYKVLLDNKDENHHSVVLSTASPYKFTNAVYEALHEATQEDELRLMELLHEETKVRIPDNLKGLEKKIVLHKDNIKKIDMRTYINEKAGELRSCTE